MDNTENLAIALKAIADEHWKNQSCPILLSGLHPLLIARIADYKNILNGKPIKQFIQETGNAHGYKLVEHPTQKAKIGIIPVDTQYAFPATAEQLQPTSTDNTKGSAALISFFKALGNLPDEEIEKVNIPVSVIVKLLK